MANKLIYQEGSLFKKAQGQPGQGPSFQQQFGILANAQIIDKYPSLSNYQVAVQLIDKKDDNSFAVCIVVYKLGENYIYIPAIFRNGKIVTGQMMQVPSMQMILPLSDAWMSWVKNKDVGSQGEQVDAQIAGQYGDPATTVRAKDAEDPFTKHASFINTEIKTKSIFDIALSMGKTASEKLLDLTCDTDFLNSCFRYYSPQEIYNFSKQAVAKFEQKDTTPHIISVMDKEASLVEQSLKQTLYRDGYIIKSAQLMDWGPAENAIKVIQKKDISAAFVTPSVSCKCQALTQQGELKDVIYIVASQLGNKGYLTDSYPRRSRGLSESKWLTDAKTSIRNKSCFVVCDGKLHRVNSDFIALQNSIEDITTANIGKPLSEMKAIPYGSFLLTKDGKAFQLCQQLQKTSDGNFCNYNTLLKQMQDGDIKKPIISQQLIEVPKGCKIIVTNNDAYREDGTQIPFQQRINNPDRKFSYFVSVADLGKAIQRCRDKNFTQLKVVSDGNQISFVGPKSKSEQRMQHKQAALHLVRQYGICPQDAKYMIKEASFGSFDRPSVKTYHLFKNAAGQESNLWEPSNLGASEVPQNGPTISQQNMQNHAQQDAKDMQQIQAAADSGIKEIFDTNALKMLVQNADPHEEIQQALPDFMITLDKLCRLLLVYRCHMEDMQQRYGAVKMKALQQSLQNTIKDFSELTIFLKLRGLNSGQAPDTGELQTGTMMQ